MTLAKTHWVIKYFALATAPFLLFELALRVAGYPEQQFDPNAIEFLQEPNSFRIQEDGPIPFPVSINQSGFRGVNFDRPKSRYRIAALGDSITFGIFVNDEQAFPARLEALLNAKQKRVEVINGGWVNTSIDEQFFALKQHIMPLKPDLVVLTFCTNDIADLRHKPFSMLLENEGRTLGYSDKLLRFLALKTATGEYLFSKFLDWKKNSYLAEQDLPLIFPLPLYKEDPKEISRLVRLFYKHTRTTDALVLGNAFSEETIENINKYVHVLEQMKNYLEKRRVEFIFVYFPAFPQVHNIESPQTINLWLSQETRDRGIRFLDLTPHFRKAARSKELYLAPIDFHPNAAGHELMASIISQEIHPPSSQAPRTKQFHR